MQIESRLIHIRHWNPRRATVSYDRLRVGALVWTRSGWHIEGRRKAYASLHEAALALLWLRLDARRREVKRARTTMERRARALREFERRRAEREAREAAREAYRQHIAAFLARYNQLHASVTPKRRQEVAA